MEKMAVAMKDIARELGLPVVTVSKVIRNHSDIGEETRQRVRKRIKELNYQPNMAARALVTGRSYSAGLIVPDLTHPFFAEVASGPSDVLRRKNYSLPISSSEGDPELERQEIKRLLSRRLDALTIASTQWTVESFRRIEEHKAPYVLIDRAFRGMPANFCGRGRHRGRPSGDRAPDIGRVPENRAHSGRRHQHGGRAPERLLPGPRAKRSEPVPGLRSGGTLD
jgi:LacI family transcriptional regulator